MKIITKVLLAVLVVVATLGLVGLIRAATTVSLGTADSFAVLAGGGITNTGTAEGHANGLTAIDFSLSTVVVASPVSTPALTIVPKLPSTGIAPDEKNFPWNIVISSGIFAALIFLYFTRRKQAF